MATPETSTKPEQPPTEFENLGSSAQHSLFAEFCQFIVDNKKWWMIPILVVLSLVGILIVLASTGMAPFIYTLF
ncbi:MAG: hypothetical protein HY290_11715 [Planctomycetia bacterium]|nr:hypothetical protein [Planctomycetia bacterium]